MNFGLSAVSPWQGTFVVSADGVPSSSPARVASTMNQAVLLRLFEISCKAMDDIYSASVTDGELLERIAAGSASAFEMIYDRHSGAAFGLAYRILNDQGAAEDVVQDAFLSVWRQAGGYGASRGAVRSWLLSIVHHRAIDYVRHRHDERKQDVDDITAIVDTVDTSEQARLNVEGEQLRAAIQELPVDQRKSIALAYFGGYTHDEIARLLGVPLGTVKGRLRIGLQKLRNHLRAHEVEAPQ